MGRILNKDKSLDVGFGCVTLMIVESGNRAFREEFVGGFDDTPTVQEVEHNHGDRIRESECTTLFFNSPLHDELYEFNKDDGEWYLVKQGQGFA